MSLPAGNFRAFHSLMVAQHSIFRNVSNGFKWILPSSLQSGRKLKFALGFLVTAVVFVSFLPFFSVSTIDTHDIPQNNVDSPSSTITQYSANVTEQQKVDPVKGEMSLNQNHAIETPAAPSSQVLPSNNLPRFVGSDQSINRTTWKAIAEHAWQYFQPGIVDSITGLPAAAYDWPYFTDWDLGVYVQVVIDAQEIGLIQKEGLWGADNRLEKILTFLENRTLTKQALPFWFYQAKDGKPALQLSNYTGAIADIGRLLVALRNLKTYDNSLQTRVDKVARTRMNYSFILTELDTLVSSSNIYDYFVASGFAAFWPEKSSIPSTIIDNIISTPKLNLNGAELPTAKISCEPIFLSIFDLKQPDPRITKLSKQVYLAHEGWYNATGIFRAFSEGPTIPGPFAYEWVVLPDGQTWVVQDQQGLDYLIHPIVYSKVAFSFLALYNTTLARNMVVYLENNLPDLGSGYCDGIHEDGINKVQITGCNTNGLIISAARYAIQSGDWP